MPEKQWLRLPVVSAGAQHLVMGYLMRRNILAYKAPPNRGEPSLGSLLYVPSA